jgi:hypothetical protein
MLSRGCGCGLREADWDEQIRDGGGCVGKPRCAVLSVDLVRSPAVEVISPVCSRVGMSAQLLGSVELAAL